MKRVLMVEDDPVVARTLQLGLAYRGFEVTPCATAQEGLEAFASQAFEWVLLDVALPDGSGYDVCRRIRARDERIPILMLTARLDEPSAVEGIEAGADDYLRKPCGLNELVARMNRLGTRERKEDMLACGPLRLSARRRLVWVGERPVPLARREFDILALLLRRPGEVVRRQDILDGLGDGGEVFERTIDSHVSHLRRKLREAGLSEVHLAPVYGVGYRLETK
jgi:DNA-binding response OmpR family regulator